MSLNHQPSTNLACDNGIDRIRSPCSRLDLRLGSFALSAVVPFGHAEWSVEVGTRARFSAGSLGEDDRSVDERIRELEQDFDALYTQIKLLRLFALRDETAQAPIMDELPHFSSQFFSAEVLKSEAKLWLDHYFQTIAAIEKFDHEASRGVEFSAADWLKMVLISKRILTSFESRLAAAVDASLASSEN